jgi:hypothetical protein
VHEIIEASFVQSVKVRAVAGLKIGVRRVSNSLLRQQYSLRRVTRFHVR